MVDASNDGLLNNTKKNRLSFESISEKQEESNDSSANNSKTIKGRATLNNNKSILKNNDMSKEMDINDISIRKKKRSTAKINFLKKRKTVKITIKEDDDENDKEKDIDKEKDKDKAKFNKFRRRDTKKKTNLFNFKRTSFKHDNMHFLYNQLKNIEDPKNNQPSSKNIPVKSILNKTILKEKGLNISLNNSNNKKAALTSLYNNKNSIVGKLSTKNRNTLLSNSEYLDKKYFHNKKFKNTTLQKGKLNLKNQRHFNFKNMFEKLKDSYLFEKSEILLFKIKVCYGFLAVFSFISIILTITDVIIFNKETIKFLNKNYNISIINNTNIEHYYFVEKRKITKRENSLRAFNLIFSVFCFSLHLIIHLIKNSFDKESKKKNKKKNYYNYNNNNKKRRATKLGVNDQINTLNENRVKIIGNDDFVTKNFVTREDIIKLAINCFISVVCYPPGINKVFVGLQDKIIYVYSCNSLFLLITFFKLSNIYFATYYLSPFNNLLYKTICSSNMVKMNFKFMFRFLLNLYPFEFILINFVVIGLVICILLYSFEYFTINVNGIWNNKGQNDLKNFQNDIYLYLFFIIKSVHGNIKTDTIIGSLVLLIGGTIGLLINSYLIFYLSQFTEFKPDEQQAYSKLIKLFNPLNNEHKASNLIKIFLLMKKMYIDNQNIEDEYKLKKENHFKKLIEKNFGLRKSNFVFLDNDSSNSISNFKNNNEHKEKLKLLKYISTEFVLKIKLINECKNFRNILLVARNYSLSFNDVLKTLEDKMTGNINQLNNKLEILIQNDQKFRNFMKFQENSVKKLNKIMAYQDFLLNYLIQKNNEESIHYLKDNKEMQTNFLNKIKNAGNGPRRMKSLFNGSIFAFSRKPARKKSSKEGIEFENHKKLKEGQNKNNLPIFDNNNKLGPKRLRSSVVRNKSNFNNINNSTNRSKTNPVIKYAKKKKVLKNTIKSLDNSTLKICQKINNLNNLENEVMEKIRQKRRSLSGGKKEVINKWKSKIESNDFF